MGEGSDDKGTGGHGQSRQVKCSVARQLRSGNTRHFPNLEDLVEAAVESGHVKDLNDLRTNHSDKISELVFAWIAHGQVGCQFAKVLARKPIDAGWLSVVVENVFPGNDLNAKLEAVLLDAPKEFEAVQFVFPEIDSPENLVRLLNLLCENPRWYWREIECADVDSFYVGLRWRLPGGQYVSWALGMASFEGMPFTRHAPFPTIVMRIKAPESDSDNRPRDGSLSAVHLADMPDLLPTPKASKALWKKTQEEREALLCGERESAAKAKVTFALPIALRASLCSATTS